MQNPRSKKLMSQMIRTIANYNLLQEGDKILVAISGGKDSYTLLDLLWQAKKRAHFDFDMVAVHLDQVQPNYDGTSIREWLIGSEIPFQIIQEDTYSVVKEKTKPGDTYCSLCSRLRRGILYTAAEKLGCNKIALGHHADDAIQTMMLNLFYAGKLQAMPAGYTTDDGRFEVIRPLIECSEKEIAAHAKREEYPIIPCNLCGSQTGMKRQYMKELLVQFEQTIPNVRSSMLNALQNIKPTHMLDVQVKAAWLAHERTDSKFKAGEKREQRFGAKTLFASNGQLKIIG